MLEALHEIRPRSDGAGDVRERAQRNRAIWLRAAQGNRHPERPQAGRFDW